MIREMGREDLILSLWTCWFKYYAYICSENVRFFIVKVLVNRLESAGKLAPLFLYSVLIPSPPYISYLSTLIPPNKLWASQYPNTSSLLFIWLLYSLSPFLSRSNQRIYYTSEGVLLGSSVTTIRNSPHAMASVRAISFALGQGSYARSGNLPIRTCGRMPKVWQGSLAQQSGYAHLLQALYAFAWW